MNRLLTIVDSKYQRLEYLESTGTQCILTNYAPSYKTSIEVKISDFTGSWIWGARDVVVGTVDFGSAYYFSSFGENQLSYPNLQTGTHIINYGKTLIVDGNTIGTFPDTTSEIDTPILIFGIRNSNETNSNVSAGKIHYFRIYEDGVLVRNFVPVLRKTDNELGMLDLVEGKFYPNAGTGKFTANLDTMYAIIQGSPTVQDGRVSNFSSSNYLKTQSLSVSVTNWELVLNIKSNAQTAFLETKNRDILIRQYSATQVVIFMSSQGNTTYDIASNLLVPLIINTNAWLKISFTGSSYVFSVSYDGINYEVKQTISSSSQIQNLFNSNYIKLGYSIYIGSAYNGVINLNRSSITIGSTKYKLQAVVGYTIVGSPTIVDGVVSGFSSSNYLTLPKPTFDNKNFEINTVFTINNVTTTRIIATLDANNFSGIHLNSLGKLTASFYDGNSRVIVESSVVPQNNTKYYVVMYRKGQSIGIKVSTDNITWTENEQSIGSDTNIVINSTMCIGTNGYYPTNYFDGSIDLNNTYIKINNKLWFNGQQA